jgi:hypothetical protein
MEEIVKKTEHSLIAKVTFPLIVAFSLNACSSLDAELGGTPAVEPPSSGILEIMKRSHDTPEDNGCINVEAKDGRKMILSCPTFKPLKPE